MIRPVLLDHLVGAEQERLRQHDAEGLAVPEIDGQLEDLSSPPHSPCRTAVLSKHDPSSLPLAFSGTLDGRPQIYRLLACPGQLDTLSDALQESLLLHLPPVEVGQRRQEIRVAVRQLSDALGAFARADLGLIPPQHPL